MHSVAKRCLDCQWTVHRSAPGGDDPDRAMIDHAIATGHSLESTGDRRR